MPEAARGRILGVVRTKPVLRLMILAAVLVATLSLGMTAASAAPPGSVQSLTATGGNGFVTASWSAPASDGGSPVFAYSVVAVKPDQSVGGWTNLLPDATSASVANLTNGVAYTVHVLAWTAGGTSVATTTATPSAGGPAATAPPQPRNVTVTFDSSGFHGVTARWTAPPNDGGAPIVAYSMVTQYGKPPFLITRWTHVGPNAREARCSDCDANVVSVFAWNAKGPGTPWVVGMFPP